jgi:hypothetical protein
VVGDGMVRTAMRVKQGDLLGNRTVFMSREAPKSRPAGVRASIVAVLPEGREKRGNARGAKGCREMDS